MQRRQCLLILSTPVFIALAAALPACAASDGPAPREAPPTAAASTPSGGTTGATQDAAIAPAREAVQAWLQQVDRADGPGSWATAAAYFKRSVSADQWSRALAAARDPLGPLRARQEVAVEAGDAPAGAPPGRYVVFRYAATYERAAKARETVTVMADPDGRWRVVGYFIR